ncbi:MAG: hypothetical protein ACFB16_04205 [Phormidesmis sp.]
MNASTQALSISIVSKIANISSIFQAQYPAAIVDFSPWALDEKTQKEFDINSLDLSFSFTQWQSHLSCGCVLLQVYFVGDLQSANRVLSKIKLTGHDYRGQRWRFSTHADWQFSGPHLPSAEAQQRIKTIVTQLHTLFGYPVSTRR